MADRWFWTPMDVCPEGSGVPCSFVIATPVAGEGFVRTVQMCPHHQGLLSAGRTHEQVFQLITQSARVRTAAITVVKRELGLAEGVEVRTKVEPDGTITVTSGATGQTRTALRNAVATEVNKLERPSGTAAVTVA